jgi:hypothetical protein
MNGDKGVNRASAAPNAAEIVAVRTKAEPHITHRTKGRPGGLFFWELGIVVPVSGLDCELAVSSLIGISTLI